ncbi:MAG: YdcF family protein [Sarcina sp.]
MNFKKEMYIIIGLVILGILVAIIGGDFTEIFIIGCILMFYGVYISFKILKRKPKKRIRIFARIYQVLVVIFIALFIVIESVIWTQIINVKKNNNALPNTSVNYIIVLGGGIHGTEPGEILKGRLNVALAYLNEHKNTKVICSGGQNYDEIVPESVAMSDYLMQNGISENRILQDNKSKSTIENLEYSKAILEKENAAKDPIFVVTSSFNILRAQMIAKDFDLNAKFLGSNSKFRYNLNDSIREFGGIVDNAVELLFIKG